MKLANHRNRSETFEALIPLGTIEGRVVGELGKIYSTSPEVAIGTDGKTYFIKGCNSNTAFSEVAGCRLAALAGLRVPAADVGMFDGQLYAAVESVPNPIRNITAWLNRRNAIANPEELFSVIAVDTWLVNDDRNLGNVVASSLGGGRVNLFMIDFEKSHCLGEAPFTGAAAVAPKELWPRGELGTILRGVRPPMCSVDVLRSIRALSIEQIMDVILPIAADLPFVTWHEFSIEALSRRAQNIDRLVEEVWATN